MKFNLSLIALLAILLSAHLQAQVSKSVPSIDPYIIVLGTLQDGGSPHLGCEKDCCKTIDPNKKVVSLGLIDPSSGKRFLFEATPDIASQIRILNQSVPNKKSFAPDGIFLTHAHIGHYAGLMFLGREAMNSKDVPVYAMPKMKMFLENNGPWSQLVTLNNIRIHTLAEDKWENIASRSGCELGTDLWDASCRFGSSNGRFTVVLIGDSKRS